MRGPFELTYRLRTDFAENAFKAHARLITAIESGADVITFPVVGDPLAVEYSIDVIREVRVW